MDSVPRRSAFLTIVTVIVLLTGPHYTMRRTVVTCCQSVVRCMWALSSPRPSGAGGQRAAARHRRRTEWKQRCSPTRRLSCGRMFHPSGSSVSCGVCAALFISNKASNCPPSSPLSRTRPAGKRADSQRRPHFHSEPINRSPPRMFPSEWAEWRGGELLNQLDNTPLLLVPPTLSTLLSSIAPSLPVWFNLFGNIRIGMFSPASLQSEIGQGHWSLTM